MPHMTHAFGLSRQKKDKSKVRWTIQNSYKHLKAARDFIAKNVRSALQNLVSRGNHLNQLGTLLKRVVVKFPENNLILVCNKKSEHNLVECINMCATVERLLDALQWAAKSKFSKYLVHICHPAASSDGQARRMGEPDNDLVLVPGPRCEGATARFEVSDVSGSGYGNDKERKDLERLDVFGNANVGQGNHRKFLVISREFGEMLERRQPPWRIGAPQNPPSLVYKPFDADHGTKILEIILQP